MNKILSFIWMGIIFFLLTGCIIPNNSDEVDANELSFEERSSYEVNGELLLSVFPAPGLVAGSSFGYLFHFTAPFETFEGKELAIYAEHQEVQERIEVVALKEIKYPSWGYEGLERHTAYINIPYAGMWRYIIEIDGDFYADLVLKVREPM